MLQDVDQSTFSVNITINCNVTLSGVKAIIINGEFKGDSLSGTVKKFSTLTNVNTADMNVTFVGRPGKFKEKVIKTKA